VPIPGSDIWQRAAGMASSATAIATTASVLSVASAAGGGTASGGSASLLRSMGHTQFLAMSVSLAVPWLPPEYIKLCQGLEYVTAACGLVAISSMRVMNAGKCMESSSTAHIEP
jgi:hypothetical protein